MAAGAPHWSWLAFCLVWGIGVQSLGKWVSSSPGMLEGPHYCKSHRNIRSGTYSQRCSLVIPMGAGGAVSLIASLGGGCISAPPGPPQSGGPCGG